MQPAWNALARGEKRGISRRREARARAYYAASFHPRNRFVSCLLSTITWPDRFETGTLSYYLKYTVEHITIVTLISVFVVPQIHLADSF